ncbi:CehA/McbA family metallohydrolase [Thermodesulfobacteriota bacterium]
MFNIEYVGNIHIHSYHSDGRGSYAEIAGKAAKKGLDFICFNDHSHALDYLNLDEEGLYDNLTLLIGLEIGKEDHHYLAFDVKELERSYKKNPQEMIDNVNSQGGFGFLAHPFEKGMPFIEKSIAYTWNDLSVKDFTGICIWNFSSRWKERVKTVFHGIFCLMFKTQTLKGPSKKTLAFWDKLCRERRIVAIGGSDAHGAMFRWGILRLTALSYDYLLNTVNIHIFLKRRIHKDFKMAKQDIYDAMKEGRLFIANDKLCPAKGFKYYFISDDGSDLFIGEETSFSTAGNLVIELPHKGEIRIFRNGEKIASYRGMEAVYPVKQKGVYRVEVYRYVPVFGWRPWIFTNPVYLR